MRVVVQLPPVPRTVVRRQYEMADIGISEAITVLMFDHGLDRGQAIRYLFRG